MEANRLIFPSGLKQPLNGFKFSVDSIFLSCFVSVKNKDKIMDLGCGCGVISFGILLKNKDKDIKIWGVDSDKEMIRCAQINANQLKLNDSFHPMLLDLREIKKCNTFGAEEFSIVVMNPPYRNTESGRLSPIIEKNMARFEQQATLEDFISIATYLLKNKGKLYIVYLSERINYLFSLLKTYNLSPRRIRFIHGNINKISKIFLLECIKNSNPQLIVDPPLIQYELNKGKNIYTKMALDFCPFFRNI